MKSLNFIPYSKENQKEKLKQMEDELFLIQRENDSSNNFALSLEQAFQFHGKEAMVQAKFYHECMLRKIPCILQVRSEHAILDAVIEINESFIIVEFKYLSSYIYYTSTEKQLNRYLAKNYPVLVISSEDDIANILVILGKKQLSNAIYHYEKETNKIRIFTYPQKD